MTGTTSTSQPRERTVTGSSTGLDELVLSRKVIVCLGSGGVGKTTVSASLARRAATLGRRAVVITVDPARRLGDAMGLESGSLGPEPRLIGHTGPGELWATMLDPRATFDRVVAEHSPDPATRARITSNNFYRNLAEGLSGTQEYLATEELFALQDDPRFDLVVVDTPPSGNAMDVLDAPGRLVRLFDNRVYRLLTGRTSGPVKVVTRAAHRFVRLVASAVGAGVVDDAIEFFTLFEDLEAGFRARASTVREILSGDLAAFVLVASPRRDTVREAEQLLDGLEERRLHPDALVVNLLHPDPSIPLTPEQLEEAQDRPGAEALRRLHRRARAERLATGELISRLPPQSRLVRIPILPDDVHDSSGLDHVTRCLGGAYPATPSP